MKRRAAVLFFGWSGVASGCASSSVEPTTTELTPPGSAAPESTSPAPRRPASSAMDHCETDADCTLENVSLASCCSTCEDVAMTTTRASTIHDGCGPLDGVRSCPSLDCPFEPKRAVCEAGTCVAKDRPTPKS